MTAEEKPKPYHSKIREDGCISFYTNQYDSFEGKNILVENVITTEYAKEIRDNLNKCLGVNVAKDMLEYSESVRNGVQQELDQLRKENERLKEKEIRSDRQLVKLHHENTVLKHHAEEMASKNIKRVIELSKHELVIQVNPHNLNNESVVDYFSDLCEPEDINNETMDEMIRRNIIVRIQAYPNNSTSFILIFHYDIELAIEMAIEALINLREGNG